MNNQKASTHPGIAAVLSFIFSGLGQIYNGEIKKGLWLVSLTTIGISLVLVGAVVAAFSLYYGIFSLKLLFLAAVSLLIGGVFICWTGIYSIFDAYKVACHQ